MSVFPHVRHLWLFIHVNLVPETPSANYWENSFTVVAGVSLISNSFGGALQHRVLCRYLLFSLPFWQTQAFALLQTDKFLRGKCVEVDPGSLGSPGTHGSLSSVHCQTIVCWWFSRSIQAFPDPFCSDLNFLW